MILVTGATGTVGREVVDLLLAGGAKVAAVTRDPSRADLPEGADVVAGDPSRPPTLATTLRGAEALFLNPATVGTSAAELLELAAGQGVERVVMLSGAVLDLETGDDPLAANFKLVEDAIKASGLEWTFLRAGEFAANGLNWAPQIRATGVVRDAYGDASTSPIHERDIAAVGVRALTDPGHAGRTYALHGAASITRRERVGLIGEAIGRPLTSEEVTHAQARYGRPALTYAEWAADNSAVFA